MASAEEVQQLLRRSIDVEGFEKLDLIEQATRLADSLNDRSLGMAARSAMLEAGTWGGFPEHQLLAFQWMISQIDQNPDLQPRWESHLLYRYKWIAGHLAEFATTPVERIERVMDDMERRYQNAGLS